MVDVSEQIKTKVDIQDLLDRMWIRYNNRNWIWDNGKFSDSYNFSNKDWKNFVTNHNPDKKHRAQGNPIEFYIQYTWCTTREAYEFFEKEYDIKWEPDSPERKPIQEMEILNDEQRIASYLRTRGIDYSRLPRGLVSLTIARTYGKAAPEQPSYCISCPMYTIEWKSFELTWYQLRSMLGKWFLTNGSDSYFLNFTRNLTKDYIIIVEGLTDFLSIRQYDEHVIWFKSCKTPPSTEMIAFLSKFKKIYLMLDNDWAGKEAKEKFKELIDANIYEIEESDDMNDLVKELKEETIPMIKGSAFLTKEKEFQHIAFAEWLKKWMDELLWRDKSTVMSWGFQKFDEKLWFLLPWQLIVVGWETWMGKSTFVNTVANNVSRQWFKVARYSLEDRMEENRINEIYHRVCYLRKKRDLNDNIPEHYIFEANMATEEEYPWITQDIAVAMKDLENFNRWIIDLSHKKMVGIEELEQLFKDVVLNEWVKLVIIDHLHYVKFEKNTRHDLAIENFMHQLNDLLRKYEVTCILVSHYKKIDKDEDPDNNSFKDGAAIAQVSNKIIHIARDKEETEDWIKAAGWARSIRYIVSKNRGKMFTWAIYWQFTDWRIVMKEASLSKQRREERRMKAAVNQQTL